MSIIFSATSQKCFSILTQFFIRISTTVSITKLVVKHIQHVFLIIGNGTTSHSDLGIACNRAECLNRD